MDIDSGVVFVIVLHNNRSLRQCIYIFKALFVFLLPSGHIQEAVITYTHECVGNCNIVLD